MKIAVIGSANADLVTKTNKLPKPGETLIGESFFIGEGGKGLNQAVAASRIGGDVNFFGAIGKDTHGEFLLESMKKNNLKVKNIKICEQIKTGIANIMLCDGENSIVIVAGANSKCNIEYIKSIKEKILECDIIVLQLEIPLDTVEFIINLAYKNNKKIILNPAPAIKLSKEIVDKVSYIIPNEHEYKVVLHTENAMEKELEKYPNKLIITNGENGVWYFDGKEVVNIPAKKVKVIDTTGAGDTFVGTFAGAIANKFALKEAIEFGVKCSGISVTKLGAQGGMPYLKDL
ncbi:ribokinase [Clostridium senegalense]|uniref:Ribokinase n=1 Tax=Clostridium senegalense TaxID=1465809 RepID=A0A6M0H3W8_9CLOT|nr:ribokinase [Clostridium senegalense]NEU04773.1 ribokinase [Clostridium senegalense]